MRAPHRAKIPKKVVRIDCGKFLLRTLKIDDASNRRASWMADRGNTRLLNSAAQAMTRDDVVAYIKQLIKSLTC